jgi:hypothetical protein
MMGPWVVDLLTDSQLAAAGALQRVSSAKQAVLGSSRVRKLCADCVSASSGFEPGYGRDLRSAAAAVLADTPSMCPLPRLRAIAPSMAACALSRISSPFARMLHIVSHCPARREAAFSPLSML